MEELVARSPFEMRWPSCQEIFRAALPSLSPHDAYRREVERCVRELHFVGLKLHTIGHGVNPLSEDGDLVFAIAHEFGIPAMVHTGPGIPFALPALCIPAAQKNPGLKIILAHDRDWILRHGRSSRRRFRNAQSE
jgi:predicted TIM-barrel fold metal-dependent hydrolase